jgi:hypothetical protein
MNKKDFLSIAEQYYDEELSSLPETATNFYDYEKTFVELFQRFGKECMEKQLNASSSTRKKKKKKR